MARDGAIVVDDGDDDELDAFDEPDDDDDEDEPPAPRQKPKPKQQPQAQQQMPDDGPTYEELQASVKRLEAAVSRNNRENATHRRLASALKELGIEDPDQLTARLAGNQGSNDRAEFDRLVALEVEKRMAETGAQTEEERTSLASRNEKLEAILRNTAIEAALSKAGFTGTAATAMRVIDLTDVKVDLDAESVTGVAEAVEKLKQEIPPWFAGRRPPPPPPRGAEQVDGGGRPGRTSPPRQTWEQRAVGQMGFGR